MKIQKSVIKTFHHALDILESDYDQDLVSNKKIMFEKIEKAREVLIKISNEQKIKLESKKSLKKLLKKFKSEPLITKWNEKSTGK